METRTLRDKIRQLVTLKLEANRKKGTSFLYPTNGYQLWKAMEKQVPQRTVYNYLAGEDIPLEHIEVILGLLGVSVKLSTMYYDPDLEKIIKSL